MSEKPLRGRVPVHRRIRPPHPSPSTHSHRLHRRVVVQRSSKKPLKFIKRCNSEPALLTVDVGGATKDHGGVIFRSRACADIFSSSPELPMPYSPPKSEGYNKDAKVVVNVTVEGSPGPVRAMVKLGSSVEETMEIVKHHYNSQGRTPQHSISDTFELHPSYFSLQCLDKSNMIGDFGNRSFYMRKCNADDNSFTGPEINSNNSPPIILFPNFISQNLNKIITLTSKLWKILCCIDG